MKVLRAARYGLKSRAVDADDTASSYRNEAEQLASSLEIAEELEKLGLTPKERSVLKLYYQHGKTLKEIAIELKLTESQICQIHGKAIKMMKEKLEEKGRDANYFGIAG